ncbi:hypothetical protein LNO81_27540 [Klebsiella variicola subsp. variicola]|nr:hypothetical protein [Klebsiella variicola subsp. variicola]
MTVEENLAMGGFFADRDQFQTRIKWVYELFPRLHERRDSARRHYVRRRAADAGDRSRSDEPAAPAAA